MLLATVGPRRTRQVALIHEDRAYRISPFLPEAEALAAQSMLHLIVRWQAVRPLLEQALGRIHDGAEEPGTPVREASVTSPIPEPVRDPICVAGNYSAHVKGAEAQTGLALSKRRSPLFFTKATGAVVGPFDDIQYDPAITSKVDYELELAVVVGSPGKDIVEARAMDHVFGYTVANDVSARDLQIVEPYPDFFRGKGLDTFMPIGPGIVPREYVSDYTTLPMRLHVNDELRQSATPAQMTRSIPELLAALSTGLSLITGDVIATGTPSGVALEMAEPRYLQHGDVVRGDIGGIGAIENRIVARAAA